MHPQERRRRRSDNCTEALNLQLAACCAEGGVTAMVLADVDGLPLAASGDRYACEEVAGRVVLIGRKIREFAGTLLGHRTRWDVQMRKIEVDGAELLLCAVGGSAEARQRQLGRSAGGVARILAA